MKYLIASLSMSLFLLNSVSAEELYNDGQNLKFTSYTFKQSSWTSDQYVGDLKDLVNFADATSHVFEYRSAKNQAFSFDVSAAIRSDENGDSELESILGAIESGGVFFRAETSSAPGYIAPSEGGKFDNKYVLGERGFTAEYLQVNIGRGFDHWPEARWGLGYIQAKQPATLNMYTTSFTSANGAYYPDSIIDPEYQHDLIGLWIEFDNLQAAMHDGQGFLLSMNRSDRLRYGWGLTMDMIFGLLSSRSNKDLEKIIRDNYGLNLKYDDPFGLGWSLTYRLEYILAYRAMDSNFGVSFGLEGRAFQGFYSEDFLGTSLSVDDGSQAGLQLGAGDNMIFQYGPFVRIAWEI